MSVNERQILLASKMTVRQGALQADVQGEIEIVSTEHLIGCRKRFIRFPRKHTSAARSLAD